MLPVTFESDNSYIQSQTTIAAKIAAIDALIDALDAQQLILAQQSEPVTEFMLNDGQTIIKGMYRNPEAIAKTIEILQLRRNRYAINGRRGVRMVDIKNFVGPRNW